MIDDGTVYRLDQDNFRWVGGNDVSGLWLREQADKLGLKAWVRSSTDQMHNIAVQGPHSRDILKKVIWTSPNRTPLEDLEWFRFTVGRIGDFHGVPVVVSRTGYSGELGYECSATRAMRARCSMRCGRRARNMSSRPSALRRSIWCGWRPG